MLSENSVNPHYMLGRDDFQWLSAKLSDASLESMANEEWSCVGRSCGPVLT